jgi:hypothetical protein
MWTTIWELDSEEFADEKGNRSRQWMHLTFTDGGLPRIKRFLTRVGGDDELVSYARSLLTTKFDPQAVADEGKLIGARARLRIDIRRYEGQNRNNVREILPPGADQSGAAAKGAFANV